jgi:hypothetical protein
MEHVWYKCPPGCEDYSCPYCIGGLGYCIVCGAAEGELTIDCPGYKVTLSVKEQTYKGKHDFINGRWIDIK